MSTGKIKKSKMKFTGPPLKGWDKEGYRYVGTILEDVKDNFRVFGESLDGIKETLALVKEKGDATFEEVGNLKEEVGNLKVEVALLTKRIEKLEQRMDRMENDISVIKQDTAFIKERLTQKIDRAEFLSLEKRVAKLEIILEQKAP